MLAIAESTPIGAKISGKNGLTETGSENTAQIAAKTARPSGRSGIPSKPADQRKGRTSGNASHVWTAIKHRRSDAPVALLTPPEPGFVLARQTFMLLSLRTGAGFDQVIARRP